jgi:hypothetical protein
MYPNESLRLGERLVSVQDTVRLDTGCLAQSFRHRETPRVHAPRSYMSLGLRGK